MDEKRLFLIDGNSILYRSYYAIQRLSTSAGFPTNAIYGFLTTLRKLLEKERPAYLGIVFDVKGPTVRHEAYQDYKAHRKPMPEDLVVQVPVLKKVLQAMEIPLFEFEKYEADDVLATLARRAGQSRVRTVIVTTDKDLLQVVDARTSVYNPAKETTIGQDDVKGVFGVGPGQVVDVLALWGDPSDNVPGVPGIGEKTAKALIQEHGSLDNLLRDLARLRNPRLREKIEQNRAQLDLSRQLVTVTADLDVPFDLQAFAVHEPDPKAVAALFQELEFTTLLQDYVKKKKPKEKHYRAILEEADLVELTAQIRRAGAVALDTETDSAFPTRARLVGMSFAVVPGEAVYVPLRHAYPGAPRQVPADRALAILREVLEDPKVRKLGQNIKYDDIVLRREDVTLAGLDLDSMVLSYLLEPNWGKHNLEKLALTYLQTTKTPYAEVVGKGKNQVTMDKVAVERVVPYACQDADLALELGTLLWDKVRERKLDNLYATVERPLIEVLAEMEIWGVRVDPNVLAELSARFGKDLGGLEGRIHELAGQEFNINSPKQLAEILFQTRAPFAQEDEDHGQPIDLDGGPGGAGSAPPPGRTRAQIPHPGQAQVHLRRCVAGLDQPRNRPHPYLL